MRTRTLIATASGTALIVVSFHKPHLTIQLPINAIETWRITTRFTTRSNRHIPFVPCPAILTPPVTSSSPGPSHLHHFPVNTPLFAPRANLRGPALIGLDHGSQ